MYIAAFIYYMIKKKEIRSDYGKQNFGKHLS
jgi:hypothetical protein